MNGVPASASRFVIACDFGSTFSGYAYGRRDNPAEIFVRYDWADQAEFTAAAYCKTITALRYPRSERSAAPDWGWTAVRKHLEDQTVPGTANLITRFKLLLADDVQRSALSRGQPGLGPCQDDGTSVTALDIDWEAHLPAGKNVVACIADYLRHLSRLAMEDLRSKFGARIGR
eukprot:jgi/Mesvir1/11650/Mv24033-RA.1